MKTEDLTTVAGAVDNLAYGGPWLGERMVRLAQQADFIGRREHKLHLYNWVSVGIRNTVAQRKAKPHARSFSEIAGV